jgi:hypothetical protein
LALDNKRVLKNEQIFVRKIATKWNQSTGENVGIHAKAWHTNLRKSCTANQKLFVSSVFQQHRNNAGLLTESILFPEITHDFLLVTTGTYLRVYVNILRTA